MMLDTSIKEINKLFRFHHIDDEIIGIQRLSGTTSGLVLKLESQKGNTYILKYDHPNQIQSGECFFNTYKNSTLLPNVLFTASDRSYFAYTFIEGTTHFNRGFKKHWLTLLIKELFNKYVHYKDSGIPGLIEYSQETWKEFNLIGIEEARVNIGDLLSVKDYNFVQSKVEKLFENRMEQGDKFLLHGDTGVHNFVFNQSTLIGVIDPSPMVGPLTYDFLYAFCSSPDDINVDTLYAAADLLEQGEIDKFRLIEEVMIQLYCRIGLCVKHHPSDLPGYLKAWEEWKQLCRQLDEGNGIEITDREREKYQ
ncbi:hypothetical protein ABES58_19800 [Paenibacillus lautus]|uniref:phosphotransferase n=1 Tax=Paenibacillus lautus TaxID=1401 RepID=UPI003D2C27BE